MVLGILFLKISNADVVFGEETLMWKLYTTKKTLPTIKQVQLVNPKELVIAALDADSETFVVHMAIREWEKMAINLDRKAQVGALLFDKALTEVPAEYSNYSNVFLSENATKLPENIGMSEHAIKLEKSKQPSFGLIAYAK